MPIQQMFLGLGGSDGTQMSASGGTTNDYTKVVVHIDPTLLPHLVLLV